MSDAMDRRDEWLHAYHDGELRGLRRWRFERALRSETVLRDELRALRSLGDMVREAAASPASPDLWDAIALRLPAVDAGRSQAAAPARGPLGWLPLGALATALVAAITTGLLWNSQPEAPGQVIRWIDSGDRNVMVIDDVSDATIIWVLDPPHREGSVQGGGRETA